MKSIWKVSSNYIGDTKMYIAYRQLDISERDHSGNREYTSGLHANRDVAQAIADELNAKKEM